MGNISIQNDAREAQFKEAKSLYIHRQLPEALAAFEALGDYKNAADYLEKCRQLERFQIGETVEYGAWKGEALRWKVADERGKMRLLISEKVIAKQPYNDVLTDTSWKECSLRAWLNDSFLKEAFSPKEQKTLMSSLVRNLRNPRYYSSGGFDSLDKLFILKSEELEKYLPTAEDRRMDGWWWLRLPGSNLFSAVAVYADGTVYDPCIHVNYEEGGVRPAMWVMLGV